MYTVSVQYKYINKDLPEGCRWSEQSLSIHWLSGRSLGLLLEPKQNSLTFNFCEVQWEPKNSGMLARTNLRPQL